MLNFLAFWKAACRCFNKNHGKSLRKEKITLRNTKWPILNGYQFFLDVLGRGPVGIGSLNDTKRHILQLPLTKKFLKRMKMERFLSSPQKGLEETSGSLSIISEDMVKKTDKERSVSE